MSAGGVIKGAIVGCLSLTVGVLSTRGLEEEELGQQTPMFVVMWGQIRFYLLSALAAFLLAGLVRKALNGGKLPSDLDSSKVEHVSAVGMKVKEAVEDVDKVCSQGDSCCGGSCKSNPKSNVTPLEAGENSIFIFYGSQTGKAKSLAVLLEQEAKDKGLNTQLIDLKSYDADDLNDVDGVAVFIASTYTGGKPCENAWWFFFQFGRSSE